MATRTPTEVLDLIATRVAAVTSESLADGFRRSEDRFTLGDEFEGASDGLFTIDMPEGQPQAQTFGATETIWNSSVNVDVAYFRGGGTLGGGDRKTVLAAAASDMQRLGDMVGQPTAYSGSTSGIRMIRFLGFNRLEDRKAGEIWRCRFAVQWQSDTVTT